MPSLKGKIAWVTGAGSGIGAAASAALAGDGATVVLTGRRREPLEAVAAKIAKSGGTACAQPGDLMSANAVEKIARFIKEKFGRLDILVNNAGLNVLERSWHELRPSSIDELIHGNLSSAFYCVAAALPMMRAQKDGILIHSSEER